MPVHRAPTPARQESPIIDPTEFEPMDMRETAETAAERNVGLRKLLSRKSSANVKTASPSSEKPPFVRTASDVGIATAPYKPTPTMSMGTDEGYSTAETSGEPGMTFAPSPAMVVAGFGLANPSGPGSSSSMAMPPFGVPMPPSAGMKRISEVPSTDSSSVMAPPPNMMPERITSIRSETRSSLSRAPSPRGARAPSPPKHALPPVPTAPDVPVECGNYDQLDHAEHRQPSSASSGSRMVEMMQPERPVVAAH
ncbi:hypothetical protein PENSPDRAFT_335256 [Peniophora sp. CONT]|nr:hypothetical protein PENSPDRAFT_335256 [Peniophora sp. CONT]